MKHAKNRVAWNKTTGMSVYEQYLFRTVSCCSDTGFQIHDLINWLRNRISNIE